MSKRTMTRMFLVLATGLGGAAPAWAGEIDGPAVHQGYVGPYEVADWNGVFLGGELASVTVAGYGGADLDLFIYDDRGNLITQDDLPDYNPTCTWSPIYTGKFTMRVVNCSPFAASYRLANN